MQLWEGRRRFKRDVSLDLEGPWNAMISNLDFILYAQWESTQDCWVTQCGIWPFSKKLTYQPSSIMIKNYLLLTLSWLFSVCLLRSSFPVSLSLALCPRKLAPPGSLALCLPVGCGQREVPTGFWQPGGNGKDVFLQGLCSCIKAPALSAATALTKFWLLLPSPAPSAPRMVMASCCSWSLDASPSLNVSRYLDVLGEGR